MSRKLFVGWLAWETTDKGLKAAFAQYGTVQDAKVVIDRETGRSRGFGFVTYEAEGDAETALHAMDGVSLDGRTLRVDTANERSPQGKGKGGGGGVVRDQTPEQDQSQTRGGDRGRGPRGRDQDWDENRGNRR